MVPGPQAATGESEGRGPGRTSAAFFACDGAGEGSASGTVAGAGVASVASALLGKAVDLTDFAWEAAGAGGDIAETVMTAVSGVCSQLLVIADKIPIAGACAAVVGAIFALAKVTGAGLLARFLAMRHCVDK
jgi:hypothetical protein